MAHYPRGLRTELRDEFLSELGPDRPLLKEWKAIERLEGHDAAFQRTHYESRFRLSAWALHRLSELARAPEKVFLVCQCEVGERCHREMLMILAQRWMHANCGPVHHDYAEWSRRVETLRWPVSESELATGERKFPA